MKTVRIRTPFWKYNAVGIKMSDVSDDGVLIKILHKLNDGSYLYPKTMWASKELVKSCRTMRVRYNVQLHIVPIDKLSVYKFKQGGMF